MSNNLDSQHVLEQKANEMIQQSKVLEAYMNDILVKESTVNKLINEAHLTSKALQILTGKDEFDSLIPLGTGVFVKGTINEIKNLFVSLGADVTVEKSKKDTINVVESKIKEFEIAMTQLNSQKQQIALKMNHLQNELNKLVESMPNRR